jgi:hypothetical protein
VKLGNAYRSLKAGGKQQEVDTMKWAAALIQDVWEYSRSIWKIWNAVIHGVTVAEARAKKHKELCRLLEEEYTLFRSNNYSKRCIPLPIYQENHGGMERNEQRFNSGMAAICSLGQTVPKGFSGISQKIG